MAVGASTVRSGPFTGEADTIVFRPIRAADADLLIDFHDRLSAHSQYLRFFGPKPRLTAREARYLADVDFESRFGIVACVREHGKERILAVGRFDLSGPTTAEAAIVVRDDYRRKGVGTAIFEQLIEIARARGVTAMSGEILAENDLMVGFLRAKGVSLGIPQGGIFHVTTSLEEDADGDGPPGRAVGA